MLPENLLLEISKPRASGDDPAVSIDNPYFIK